MFIKKNKPRNYCLLSKSWWPAKLVQPPKFALECTPLPVLSSGLALFCGQVPPCRMPRKVCHAVCCCHCEYHSFSTPFCCLHFMALLCAAACVREQERTRVIVTCIRVDLLRSICIPSSAPTAFPQALAMCIGNLMSRQCHIICYPCYPCCPPRLDICSCDVELCIIN